MIIKEILNKEGFIVKHMVNSGVPMEELDGEKPASITNEKKFLEANIQWQRMLNSFLKIKLPVELKELLNTNRKDDQVKLLKRVVLTPDILMSFLILATEKGYTLSQYTSQFDQKGVDISKMPFAYHVQEDGKVQTIGNSQLSEGQLKQALEHRKVLVAKILDKGEHWHCFFATYKSLRGEETWLGEKQPHYHYVSSGFGIKREEVVKQLKSEKYKLGNLPHIKLEAYGNQPRKEGGQ